MDFLDDQATFDSTFGTKPTLLGSNPTRLENTNIRRQVHGYAEKCMFDVFLEACRADYVGGMSTDSEKKMIREVCKMIGNL